MILTKRWCAVAADSYKNSSEKHTMDLNQLFANQNDNEDIYPLTVREIAEEQIKEFSTSAKCTNSPILPNPSLQESFESSLKSLRSCFFNFFDFFLSSFTSSLIFLRVTAMV